MTGPPPGDADAAADRTAGGQTPDEAAADVAEDAGSASPTTAQAQRDLDPPD